MTKPDTGGQAKDETLLDKQAGRAMQGILSSGESLAALAELSRNAAPCDPTAKVCYELAKAMIAEKRRREE